jgi:uncharacterized membrane protein YhaH (DUF805 family)
MTADVFVSYARDDLPSVRPLVGMLEAQGWSVFWDRQILPGQAWSTLIEEKLSAAKAVVVVWSRASVQSEWVKAEAMAARERGILVPVRIDAAPIPLPFGLIQTANLGPEGAGGSDDIPHLMTNLSRLVALPVTDAKAAARFAAAPTRSAAPAGPALGGTDWKHVFMELDGRLNRKFYWIGILAMACFAYVLEFIGEALIRGARPELAPVDAASQAMVLGFFATLYPSVAVAVKRLHDCGWSGWWAAPLMVCSFIASSFSPYLEHGTPEEAVVARLAVLVLGIAPLVALGAIPGRLQPNAYGPPPS